MDDEILQLELIGKIIKRYRPAYQVTTQHDPAEALRMLETGDFNALLTDVKMPGMSGIELISKARAQQGRPLEILILSGFDDFQYARSAISFDVLEYLLKPVDAAGLQRALRKLEQKLEEDELHLSLRRDRSRMACERQALALFKLANGMPLSEAEGVWAQAFGPRARLALVRQCADIEALLGRLPQGSCAQPLGEGAYCLFLPGDGPVAEGAFQGTAQAVLGLPGELADLARRYQELGELAQTGEKLGVARLKQRPAQAGLCRALARGMEAADAAAVENLALPLRLALLEGSLSWPALCGQALAAVEAQLAAGRLKTLYASRQEDFLRVLGQKLEQAQGPEELCRLLAGLLCPQEAQPEAGFAHNVRVYIDAHFGEACGLGEIARAFHYSTAHFSRLFSAHFGVTYTRYLADYRLRKAQGLLENTELPVREIAERVGIGDAGYFIRLFKEKYRISPERYRRQGGGASPQKTPGPSGGDAKEAQEAWNG